MSSERLGVRIGGVAHSSPLPPPSTFAQKSSNVLRGWPGLEESPSDYAERTHRRHLEEIVLHMSMITHGNKEKQVMLINSMLRKLRVPHPQQLSAREVQLAEVKENLWEVLKLVIQKIKPEAGGRPLGEHFVVHQIIHSLVSAAVTPKTRHMASGDLGMRCRSLMNFAGHLERLIPAVDARGIPTTSTFCSYKSESTIYIPCSLLRLKLDLTTVRQSTLAKQPREEDPTAAFKIKADDKERVLMLCRFY